GLRQLTEVERILQVRQAPRVGAGCDAQAIPCNRCSARELDRPPLQAELDDALSQNELDAELSVLLGRPERKSLPRHGAQEVALGEMRAFVGRIWLRADESDPPVESGIAKTRRDGAPGGTAADDYHPARKPD